MVLIHSKKSIILLIVVVLFVITCSLALFKYFQYTNQPTPIASEIAPNNTTASTSPSVPPIEPYQGEVIPVANSFSVKTPGGWTASISNNANFLAIMFARPNKLESLVYNANTAPIVDQLGIPAWNGLTEHFYIIAPTGSRQFNPNSHLEITSEPFTFNDETVGTRYLVLKHANEAKKWGGLQKDTEWQGRTYIYEKDGKHIEAHLAVYPSSAIDINFYENVVKTLQL